MVNAPQMWRNKRAEAVLSIQKSIRDAASKGLKPEYSKLVVATMANIGISKKTAIEYIQIAAYNEGVTLDEKS